MKSRKGKWTLDQIHNGQNGRNFIFFAPKDDDHTCGVFLEISSGNGPNPAGFVQAGEFRGAIPHIGDAAFETAWKHQFKNLNEAYAKMAERLGVQMILATIGANDYRRK